MYGLPVTGISTIVYAIVGFLALTIGFVANLFSRGA
jgi:LPXTG-motif cell wall-anchored protein